MNDDEYVEEEAVGLPEFLQDPIGMLRRRWIWMAAALGAGLGLTVAFLATVERTYIAKATILVASQRIPKEFVRPTVEEDSLQQINAMVGQVLTRTRLAGLVEEHALYPELEGERTMDELTMKLRQHLLIETEPGVTHTRDDAARLLEIGFEHRDPIKAAVVANDIAGLFTAENLRRRSQQARLTTEFLQRELEQAEAALREHDRRIREFKEQHRGELPADLEANLGRLERLQQQRQSLALQIAEASNRITLLSQGQPAEESPDASLATLRAELARQLGVHTERHPDVIALKRQIAAVEAQIAESPPRPAPAGTPTNALVAAEQASLVELRRQLAATEAELAELDDRVARTPKREEELAALEQRATVLRESYLDFLRKVKEAELAESLEAAQHGERFSVLDRAVPPTSPVQARFKYLLAGIVASLALAGGVGLLIEVVDPVLFDAEQIERLTDLPVLGSVPHIS